MVRIISDMGLEKLFERAKEFGVTLTPIDGNTLVLEQKGKGNFQGHRTEYSDLTCHALLEEATQSAPEGLAEDVYWQLRGVKTEERNMPLKDSFLLNVGVMGSGDHLTAYEINTILSGGLSFGVGIFYGDLKNATGHIATKLQEIGPNAHLAENPIYIVAHLPFRYDAPSHTLSVVYSQNKIVSRINENGDRIALSLKRTAAGDISCTRGPFGGEEMNIPRSSDSSFAPLYANGKKYLISNQEDLWKIVVVSYDEISTIWFPESLTEAQKTTLQDRLKGSIKDCLELPTEMPILGCTRERRA